MHVTRSGRLLPTRLLRTLCPHHPGRLPRSGDFQNSRLLIKKLRRMIRSPSRRKQNKPNTHTRARARYISVIHWFSERKNQTASANPTKHLLWQNNYYYYAHVLPGV